MLACLWCVFMLLFLVFYLFIPSFHCNFCACMFVMCLYIVVLSFFLLIPSVVIVFFGGIVLCGFSSGFSSFFCHGKAFIICCKLCEIVFMPSNFFWFFLGNNSTVWEFSQALWKYWKRIFWETQLFRLRYGSFRSISLDQQHQ